MSSGAIETPHGPLPRIAFLPDATRGVVRGVSADDLRAVGVQVLMVNAFHLMTRPGTRLVQRLGGIHRFMGWDRPIVADSGGFQALSLIRENPSNGAIRPSGLIFRLPDDGGKVHLSPEKCIRAQFQLGADVMIALDDCTFATDPIEEQRASVARTIRWARACKEEFDRQIEQRRPPVRPLLVGVVQGGNVPELRRECMAAQIDLGVDGFGFGGWPVDELGALQLEAFSLLAETIPPQAPLFALGVGRPDHLVTLATMFRRVIFDSTLPTRDARHHRLYVQRPGADAAPLRPGVPFYDMLYILDREHANAAEPLSPACDCPCCRRYSRGYLHHLFKVKDALAERLATQHNLRFFSRLAERLAAEVQPAGEVLFP